MLCKMWKTTLNFLNNHQAMINLYPIFMLPEWPAIARMGIALSQSVTYILLSPAPPLIRRDALLLMSCMNTRSRTVPSWKVSSISCPEIILCATLIYHCIWIYGISKTSSTEYWTIYKLILTVYWMNMPFIWNSQQK
jgi:hypothetical protein